MADKVDQLIPAADGWVEARVESDGLRVTVPVIAWALVGGTVQAVVVDDGVTSVRDAEFYVYAAARLVEPGEEVPWWALERDVG